MSWYFLIFLILIIFIVLIFLNINNIGKWAFPLLFLLIVLAGMSGLFAYDDFKFWKEKRRITKSNIKWNKRQAEIKGLEDFGKKNKYAKYETGVGFK